MAPDNPQTDQLDRRWSLALPCPRGGQGEEVTRGLPIIAKHAHIKEFLGEAWYRISDIALRYMETFLNYSLFDLASHCLSLIYM